MWLAADLFHSPLFPFKPAAPTWPRCLTRCLPIRCRSTCKELVGVGEGEDMESWSAIPVIVPFLVFLPDQLPPNPRSDSSLCSIPVGSFHRFAQLTTM